MSRRADKQGNPQSALTAKTTRRTGANGAALLPPRYDIELLDRTRASKTPTTLSATRAVAVGAGILGSVAGLGLSYWAWRHSQVTAALEVPPLKLADRWLYATVLVDAGGLLPTEWVDYQIKWGRHAVPRGDHLGQEAGCAGGWVTDRPPPGQDDPLRRSPNNPRYQDPDGNDNWEGSRFHFADAIQQPHAMVVGGGTPEDRCWWFRAIVRHRATGIPLRTSNVVEIEWPERQPHHDVTPT